MAITKKQFSETVKIYKSHRLAYNLISVTYAYILGTGTISSQHTIIIENRGGALTSLYNYKCV
jgi:hypothetical protein